MWGWGANDKGQVGTANWKATSIFNNGNTPDNIIYDGIANKYTLFSSNISNTALMSSDGLSWGPISLPSNSLWSASAGFNTKIAGIPANIEASSFVAANASDVLAQYSMSTNAWTTKTLPSANNWTTMTQNGSRFFIFSSNSSKVVYFVPAINLASFSTGEISLGTTSNSIYWKSAASYSKNIVAISYNNNIITRSLDSGNTWTITNMPVSANWEQIIYVGPRLIAIASNLDAIYISEDNGTTWTQKNLQVFGGWSSITYFNNTLILVAKNGLYYLISSDSGNTWSKKILPSGLYVTPTPTATLTPTPSKGV